MTPTEVWDGFNPVKEPLETSIISSDEKDNFVCTKLFFTSEKTENGHIRVFTEIYYDKRWSDVRATLLVAPTLTDKMDYKVLIDTFLKEGYVVCLFDYCGNFKDNINHTTFPTGLEYCSFPECRKHTDKIESDARHTPWFEWTKIARRAISMLEEHRLVDKTKIGIAGFGAGAQIAWQVAGIDGRVRALIPINGGGYLWRKGKAKFASNNIPTTDEERAFSTGVGAETYARFVTCPTCFVISSNGSYFNVDRAGDIFHNVASKQKQLIISHGISNQITKKSIESLLMWMRENFALEGSFIPKPIMSFVNIENSLYLKVYTAKKAVKKHIYVSYGEPFSTARFWKELSQGQKTEHHEYTYFVPVKDNSELIVAYCTFEYEDGRVLSTPVDGIFPDSINIEETETEKLVSSKLIYNSHMGLGAFSAWTNDAFLDETVLCLKEGPFSIKGIMTKRGSLALCRSKNEIEAIASSTLFQFDAFSSKAKEINIQVLSYPEMKYYKTTLKLKGGEFWQKVMLSNTDFKSDEGKPLQKFSDSKMCIFTNASNVLFNNLLWI